MYLVIERTTGKIVARKKTEAEAYREKSIIEGRDIMNGRFEPCTYLVRQEAILDERKPM